MIVLDTDVCIDLQRNHAPTVRVLEALEAREALAVTAITVQELVQGAYRAKDPDRTIEAVRLFLSSLEILEFDAAAGWMAGRLSAELSDVGTRIGDLDTMIAACVIAHGGRLLTRNRKHFERVRGLRLEPLQ